MELGSFSCAMALVVRATEQGMGNIPMKDNRKKIW
jgi:hypothetical protein